MKLEDEVNILVPFENNREKVPINLAYTYGVILEKTLSVLGNFDINDQHFNILKILADQAPMPVSVGEIKRMLLNKRGDLTRLLDKLYAMEFITREVDLEDRRVVLITLTNKGAEQLKEMDARLVAQRNQGNYLSEEEAAQLNDLLDKLRS